EESHRYWGQEFAVRNDLRGDRSGANIDNIRPRIEVSSVIKASQAISTEIVLDRLLDRMMTVVSECAGATRGVLLLPHDESWSIAAEWAVSTGTLQRTHTILLEDFEGIAHSAVRYVERTRQPLCVDAVSKDPRFEHDPHVRSTDQRSVLCIPVHQQGRIVTILYLENELVEGAFAEDHVEVLRMLSSQTAISIEHANLYSEMEDRVAARTVELKESNDRLKTVFDNVAQGLLLVDREGNLTGEYPPILKRWFPGGVPSDLPGFFESDSESQQMFQIGWEQVLDGFLPLEVCVEQLPGEVQVNQNRILDFSYRPILDEDRQMRSMLVVVSDVTLERANAKAEIRQRQLMTVFENVSKDPVGIHEFLCESEQIIEEILRGVSGPEVDRRLVHTLKGNTALYGLEEISVLCHELERDLAEEDRELQQPERMRLAEEWLRARLDIERFVKQGSTAIRVPVEVYQRLLAEMRAAGDDFAEDLSLWTLESDRSRLDRIAEQLVQLAERLGKSPVQVQVETDGVYFPDIWRGFFAALVHVIRNAVDHGLENADERRAAGKSQALLTLRSRVSDSGEFVLEVSDDGRGIDWTAIRAKAAECGLPCQTERDLTDALFSDGFSMRQVTTPVSGRGVGLPAVRAACEELGGRIEVESKPGQGTRWRFVFPGTLIRRSPRPSAATEL
ncbi:MAG: ATP-binding protein, partial [Planctomycetota bacterium]